MSKIKPLSAAQQCILTLAASRADHAVLPPPDGIPARGAVPQRLIAALLSRRLIEKRPAKGDAVVWRRDADGAACTLALTQAGLATASADQVPAATTEAPSLTADDTPAGEAPAPAAAPAAAVIKMPTGKLGNVVTAISDEGGATIDELTALTGWLAHTARAALTRLRQRGYPIRLARTDKRTAYVMAVSTGAPAQ